MPLFNIKYSDRRHSLFPIYPLKYGVNYKQSMYTYPLGATSHQILYIEGGECFITINNVKRCYSKGTAMYVAKGVPIHYEPTSSEFCVALVAFDGTFTDSIKNYYGAEKFKHHQSNEIGVLIHQGYELAKNRADDDVLLKHTFDLVSVFFTKQNNQAIPSALEDACAYIEKHYQEDISVTDIASFVGVSSSFLTRLFRDYKKCSPLKYLTEKRLDAACQLLLQSPDMAIQAVANKCGFLDSAYFCRLFKKEIGETPKKYAKHYFTEKSVEGNPSSHITDIMDIGTGTVISEDFSTEPIIVDHISDINGSGWVRNRGYDENNAYHHQNICWNDGYITLTGRIYNMRSFYYVSDLMLKPGQYKLSLDARTPSDGELTTVRIAICNDKYLFYHPGVNGGIKINNHWERHTIDFTVGFETTIYLQIYGGPSHANIHDFCIKNFSVEKVQ